MLTDVSFEPIQAATREAAEDGYLVYANRQLVALLVPAETGWFLQLGLGPCEREGLIFNQLREAEIWVLTCLSRASRAARDSLRTDPARPSYVSGQGREPRDEDYQFGLAMGVGLVEDRLQLRACGCNADPELSAASTRVAPPLKNTASLASDGVSP